MNMVSSNINQWTLLMAMLPIVLSLGAGHITALPMDDQQELEVLMTMGQQLVGLLFLINMELAWWEAGSLFALWFIQFVFSAISPETKFWGPIAGRAHVWITGAYYVWAAVELVRIVMGKRKPQAFVEFGKMWRTYVMAAK
jgi:cation:H+ antiporter